MRPRRGCLRAHNHALSEAGERVCLRALSSRPQSCLAELARELDCLRAGLKPAPEPRLGLRVAAGVLGFAFVCAAVGYRFGSRGVVRAEEQGRQELDSARAAHSASKEELEAALDVLRLANEEVALVRSELQDSSALMEEGRARHEQVSSASRSYEHASSSRARACAGHAWRARPLRWRSYKLGSRAPPRRRASSRYRPS